MPAQSWGQVLVSSQADGNVLTAAAAASMIPAAAKFTLPQNFFSVIGQQLLIRATGRISTAVTTPGTARFDLRFGVNVVFDSQAIVLATADAYVTQPWWLEILLTCRAIGATANLFQAGKWTSMNIAGSPATPPKGSLTANLPWNTAPAVGANFDSTATQQIDCFFTQTVATGSLTCHQYQVISLN